MYSPTAVACGTSLIAEEYSSLFKYHLTVLPSGIFSVPVTLTSSCAFSLYPGFLALKSTSILAASIVDVTFTSFSLPFLLTVTVSSYVLAFVATGFFSLLSVTPLGRLS